jgi:hypothetical protein
MTKIGDWSLRDWNITIKSIFSYLLSKWRILVFAILIGAVFGYLHKRNVQPTYTATISFVLATESSKGGQGLAGLASQMGFDGGMISGSENVFSGENIIQLFKSKKMVRRALLSEIDSNNHQSLLNLIAYKLYPTSKSILPFPNKESEFNNQQKKLFRTISDDVLESFIVFKKDKKLIFYYISATSNYQDVAFHIANSMLAQTSSFFIETKMSAAVRGLKLLQKESDSLDRALNGIIRSSATVTDNTFNLNPSQTVQRTGTQLNQAKAMIVGSAYSEVMRNLEMAKINVQKETPLFGIIDEPELPLNPEMFNLTKYMIITSLIALFITILSLSLFKFLKLIKSPVYK